MYRSFWNQEACAHGPIVLAIALWLFWRAGMGGAQALLVSAAFLGLLRSVAPIRHRRNHRRGSGRDEWRLRMLFISLGAFAK
jgi:hypothetical protein